MQNLTAIGLQQYVLHAEGDGAHAQRDQAAFGVRLLAERLPGFLECRLARDLARSATDHALPASISATTFRIIVARAVPWTTWISFISVKCASNAP